MSSNVYVATDQGQSLLNQLAQISNILEQANTLLNAASDQIGPGRAWSGPHADAWREKAQIQIANNKRAQQDNESARLDAKVTMSNISMAGGGASL